VHSANFCLLLDREDGGITIHRNVGQCNPSDTVLHPTGLCPLAKPLCGIQISQAATGSLQSTGLFHLAQCDSCQLRTISRQYSDRVSFEASKP
jgi:hypothetical protein